MIEFNDSNFDELVLKATKPVIVDFWAEWCGPCRVVSPILEQLSEEFKDNAIIGKVNVDQNYELSGKFGIKALPTVLFFKNGKIENKQIGAVNKSTYSRKLEDLL
jgi:thioredoxin 1